MALTMQLLILNLLPAAFLLPPAAQAGEITGGREAQPHSRPYMAYLDIQRGTKYFFCGGFLVTENFVLTAAHCNGDKINVKLGAHNIRKPGGSEEVISAVRCIPHLQYNSTTINNDIMLLQGFTPITGSLVPWKDSRGTDVFHNDRGSFIVRSDLGYYLQASDFLGKGSSIKIHKLHPACLGGDHYIRGQPSP